MKKKEALKRKAEPESTGRDGAPKKRRRKEWWDRVDGQRREVEEDDDVEHYRKEVTHAQHCAIQAINTCTESISGNNGRRFFSNVWLDVPYNCQHYIAETLQCLVS